MLEVLELNLEEEVNANVWILDKDEFANLILLLDGSKLDVENVELGVLVLDDKELLGVMLDNVVVVLLVMLVVVVLELFFDEMELGECELVELVNAKLEPAAREEDDIIGVVVDEDEFRNLEILLVELKLFEVVIPAAELVFTAVERVGNVLGDVLR
jgi:hypothetical protein